MPRLLASLASLSTLISRAFPFLQCLHAADMLEHSGSLRLVETSVFEAKNKQTRAMHIKSNKQRPSRDIAVSYADLAAANSVLAGIAFVCTVDKRSGNVQVRP